LKPLTLHEFVLPKQFATQKSVDLQPLKLQKQRLSVKPKKQKIYLLKTTSSVKKKQRLSIKPKPKQSVVLY